MNETTSIFEYGPPSNPLNLTNDNLEGPFADGLANWTSTDPSDTTTVIGSAKVAYKNNVSELDMVALLGIHTIGYNVQNNSGFAGPWGTDRFNLTNQLYNLILGRAPFNV